MLRGPVKVGITVGAAATLWYTPLPLFTLLPRPERPLGFAEGPKAAVANEDAAAPPAVEAVAENVLWVGGPTRTEPRPHSSETSSWSPDARRE